MKRARVELLNRSMIVMSVCLVGVVALAGYAAEQKVTGKKQISEKALRPLAAGRFQ